MTPLTLPTVQALSGRGCLALAMLFSPLVEAAACEESTRQWTIAELAAGMEETWSRIQDRTIEYSKPPMRIPAADARADHPDRTEYTTAVARDGRYHSRLSLFHEGRPTRRYEQAWDGNDCYYLTEDLEDLTAAPNMVISPTGVPPESFAFELTGLSRAGKSFHGLMRESAARLAEYSIIQGARCAVVEFLASVATDAATHRSLIRLFIDPAVGFWPRRIEIGRDAASKPSVVFILDDFRLSGQVFFPHWCHIDNRPNFESFHFVRRVTLNERFRMERFRVVPPAGCKITNSRTGKVFLAGGERDLAAREAALKEAIATPLDSRGTPTLRNSKSALSDRAMAFAAGVCSVIAFAAAWLLKRRTVNRDD